MSSSTLTEQIPKKYEIRGQGCIHDYNTIKSPQQLGVDGNDGPREAEGLEGACWGVCGLWIVEQGARRCVAVAICQNLTCSSVLGGARARGGSGESQYPNSCVLGFCALILQYQELDSLVPYDLPTTKALCAVERREGQRINGPARLESLTIYSQRSQDDAFQHQSSQTRPACGLHTLRRLCPARG